MNQLTIDFNSLAAASATGAAAAAAQACLAKAQRIDPEFPEKAKAEIMAHLRVVGQASGEDLVEIAKAHGAIPENGDKAFGGVFLSLSRSKQIVCLRADLPRRHGHGTSGGKLWGLVR
jgi:hypothetical protein